VPFPLAGGANVAHPRKWRLNVGEYLLGFANHHASEAVSGALPVGCNSPQQVPFGLYAEQLSGTAFTAPRHENRRSWLYRLRPSANHPPFIRYDGAPLLRSEGEIPPDPNRLRWDPLPLGERDVDFLDGLVTVAGNGDVSAGSGCGIHLYAANQSMRRRAFFSADGELLIIPEQGRLRIVSEMGILDLPPLHVGIIPRGLRFRVELDEPSRGYVCENYGSLLRLPELGPIGSNGLANSRDFETPVAAFEDVDGPHELIQKFQGRLWATTLGHSPLDVVAWHGNLAPHRYDLRRFNTINTVSYDHPDPSIFTVLTSPSETAGTANVDFAIFPPRWMVAENTFRPPWFHRNIMSEYMGLIQGAYDAKTGGFVPGGGSLHNCMSSHGPDKLSYEQGVAVDLEPHKIGGTMAFMIESRHVFRPTRWAMETPMLQRDYDGAWAGFQKARVAS